MPETDPNAQQQPPVDPPEQTDSSTPPDAPDPAPEIKTPEEPPNLPAPEQAGDVRASDEFLPDVPGSAPHSPDSLDTISETTTIFPAEGQTKATAQALLDAADDPRDVVYSEGAFVVPKDLADRANIPDGDVRGADLETNAPKGNQRAPRTNRGKI